MECPTEDWIDAIVDNPVFQKYQLETAINKDEVAQYIVHFTPENVLQNSKYINWISKFGPKTLHLIVNEQNDGYTSEALHRMQHQLNLIHPNIFPLFGDHQNFIENSSNEEKSPSNMEIIENEEEIVKKLCEKPHSTVDLGMRENKIEVKTSSVSDLNISLLSILFIFINCKSKHKK